MPRASEKMTLGRRPWSKVPAVLLLLLGACGPVLEPARSGMAPDVRGTWTGTWAGQPLSLVIMEQIDEAGTRGVYLGSWQVLGEQTPGVTGILTSTIRGERLSANASGRIGYVDGALVLIVRAETTDGVQTLRLAPRGPDRLLGAGESSFRWGPRGHVELTRRPPVHPGAVPRIEEGLT